MPWSWVGLGGFWTVIAQVGLVNQLTPTVPSPIGLVSTCRSNLVNLFDNYHYYFFEIIILPGDPIVGGVVVQ